MSTYKLKKHIKTKKIKYFKIPFFGHQLLPQWYTAAYFILVQASKTIIPTQTILIAWLNSFH